MLAMQKTLRQLHEGEYPTDIMDFATVRNIVGFDDYYKMEKQYIIPDSSE